MISIATLDNYLQHALHRRLLALSAESILCLISLLPALGRPAQIPGRVYASNYDVGGQGHGYQDTAGANPGLYRKDGVDLKASSDAPADTGYVLGWRTTGEWTNYTINAQSGTYTVTARVESAFNTGTFHINADGKTVIPSHTVPLTGPWDTASSWKTLPLGTITLTAGSHVIEVYVDAPWFDLNYISFTLARPTPTPTPSNAFYINPTSALGNGSGSNAANAADASSSAKYNAIVNAHHVPGTIIHYAAGTYLCSGGYQMYNNVSHQGSGIDSTIIRLENNAANPDGCILQCNGVATISGFKFFDATVDFNTVNQNWWTSVPKGQGRARGFFFNGTPDHCTIQRVKFINMGGVGNESFPIIAFNDGNGAPGNINNMLIDSCIFTQPVQSGNSAAGLTCIALVDYYPSITIDTTCVVSNCQFLNCFSTGGFSDFDYAQCGGAPIFTSCTATGMDAFWYQEPGSSSGTNTSIYNGVAVQVTNNTLTNCGPILFINIHSNGTYGGTVNLQNNTLRMAPGSYGNNSVTGILLQNADGSGNPAIGNITIESNTFTNSGAPTPAAAATAGTLNVSGLSILSNTFLNFPANYTMQQALQISGISNYTESANVF